MKVNKKRDILYLYIIFIAVFILLYRFNYLFKFRIIGFIMPIILLIISILGIRRYVISKIEAANKLLLITSCTTLFISIMWIIINLLLLSMFFILFQ
jgi:hypothetical protein